MSELEKLENTEKSNWGGARINSGRKPLLNKAALEEVKLIISQHLAEIDENDLQKRERILVLLDILYEEGKKGNISAIKEYFDRQMGKVQDKLDVTSDGKPLIQLSEALAKKYDITPDTGTGGNR